MIVHEQQARSGVAGHINIRPAIIVKIGGDRGQPIAVLRRRDSGCGADVGKRAISFVAVEAVLAVRKPARAAGYRHSHPAAIRRLAGLRGAFQIEVEIVGDKQVEVAVAVVIEESASRAPAVCRLRQTGGLGHVRESAVAVIAIEDVLSPVGDEQIVEAVIVVVADADAAGPSRL